MVVIQGCYTKPTNDNGITYYYNDDHNNNSNDNNKDIKKKEGCYYYKYHFSDKLEQCRQH